MEHPRSISPRSIRTPHSPPAPLALSEFMAQTAPGSDIATPSEKPALTLDVPRPEAFEDLVEAPVHDKPRARSLQQRPRESQPAPSNSRDTPAPTDWLATRQQLLPRKTQGRKADWIRGWSEAVSVHGDETYCACSATVDSYHGQKAKASEPDDMQAALQRTSSLTKTNTHHITPTMSGSEPELCRNCSRPPSPPPSTTVTTKTSDKPSWRSLISKRVTKLLMRVRPSKSGYKKRDTETHNMTWGPEEYQPRWATTNQSQKRFLVRLPSPPPTEQKSRSMDIFLGRRSHPKKGIAGSGGVAVAGAASSHSGLNGLSDSDANASPRGLSRSMSRLQRAAALLQRGTALPKG